MRKINVGSSYLIRLDLVVTTRDTQHLWLASGQTGVTRTEQGPKFQFAKTQKLKLNLSVKGVILLYK